MSHQDDTTDPADVVELDDAAEPGRELALPDDVEVVLSPAEEAAAAADRFAQITAELAQLQVEAAEIAAAEQDSHPEEGAASSAALVPTGERNAVQVKRSLGRTRSALARKQSEIAAKAKELEALMNEQMTLVRQQLEPMQKLMRRLEESVWTVNLYLGRDEELIQLADGEAAPAEEPIVIRQMVLAMDEESAIDPERGGIDALSIEAFDEWLVADPARLDQVLPERKGVVALVPRFGAKEYDDPWKTAAVGKMNEQTYFLIRNGERVYRTSTDFEVGKRLVPTANEFTSFFSEQRTDYDAPGRPRYTVPIEPGTDAWLRAEERADARSRHFMRVALILQGLVDRTTVFQPLPEQGISFLHSADHQAGRVRFLTDAEHALETGRESFRDWQKRLNSELRPGMRIVGAFTTDEWRSHRWKNHLNRSCHSRVKPPHAAYPSTGELYTLESIRPDGGLVFRYERDEEVYDPKVWVENPDRPGWGHHGEYRKPKTKASCVIYPNDSFVLPYDLARVDDMEAFLGSRANRKGYVDMFPILKAAIRAKRAEAVEEAPFRQMLAGVLARDNAVSIADATEAVGELVDWWKLANQKHRPLVGDEGAQAKAVRAIVAEHKRRLADAAHARDDQPLTDTILRSQPDALLIARKRDGRLVSLAPQPGDAAEVFVVEREYSRAGELAAETDWKLASSPRIARWTLLHESERWTSWPKAASLNTHLTGPEKQAATTQIVAETIDDERLLAIAYDPETREFVTYLHHRDAITDPEHPLTGEIADMKLREARRGWRRTTGKAVALADKPTWWPETSLESGRWGKLPWIEEELLHLDDALFAHVQAEHARYETVQARRRKLWDQARRAHATIASGWVARAEAQAKARFLEDYDDEGLWEGHRKTLKLSYPHDRDRYSRTRNPNAFEKLIDRLVESEVDLAGLSVAEAAALVSDIDLAAIPDDLHELRFG